MLCVKPRSEAPPRRLADRRPSQKGHPRACRCAWLSGALAAARPPRGARSLRRLRRPAPTRKRELEVTTIALNANPVTYQTRVNVEMPHSGGSTCATRQIAPPDKHKSWRSRLARAPRRIVRAQRGEGHKLVPPRVPVQATRAEGRSQGKALRLRRVPCAGRTCERDGVGRGSWGA